MKDLIKLGSQTAKNGFKNEDDIIKKKGCLRIGKITVRRKGGDGGRKTAQMLQFKIDPLLLFED